MTDDKDIQELLQRKERASTQYADTVREVFVETPRRGVSTPIGVGCSIHIPIQ